MGEKSGPVYSMAISGMGNIGVDTATGNTFVFDFASVYGHNECKRAVVSDYYVSLSQVQLPWRPIIFY